MLTFYEQADSKNHNVKRLKMDLVMSTGRCYQRLGLLDRATILLEEALKGYVEEGLTRMVLRTLHVIADMLMTDLCNFNDAHEIFTRALEGKERVLPSDHPSTIDTVHSLGCLLMQKKMWKEAQSLLTRAKIVRVQVR